MKILESVVGFCFFQVVTYAYGLAHNVDPVHVFQASAAFAVVYFVSSL